MKVNFLQSLRQEFFSNTQNNLFSSNQKKVAAIALVIFGCIALAYMLFCRRSIKGAIPDQNKDIPDQKKALPVQAEHKSPILEKAPQLDPEFTLIQLADGQWCKTHRNGIIEQGHFFKDQLIGQGKRLYPDGYGEIKELIGAFVDGDLNGYGIALFFDGTVRDGNFLNGTLMHGRKTYPNGTEEHGNFEYGQLTGQGKRIFKDGKIHEGTFVNGHLQIKLEVLQLKAAKITCEILIDDSIKTFYEKVSSLTGMSPGQFRLIFAGNNLDQNSDLTLEDYRIRNNCTIHCMQKIRGD